MAVVALVLGLLGASEVVSERGAGIALGDARLERVSGEQRMLTERLAQTALRLAETEGPETSGLVQGLESTVELWTIHHEGFRSVDAGPVGERRCPSGTRPAHASPERAEEARHSMGEAGHGASRRVNSSRLNFNCVAAAAFVGLGVALALLIPSQIEKPLLILGQTSGGLDPALFPSIVAGALVVDPLVTG